MKDLTPQQEAERLYQWFFDKIPLLLFDENINKVSKQAAKFTAQQIADNTTGATKIFYQEVIKEIEKL